MRHQTWLGSMCLPRLVALCKMFIYYGNSYCVTHLPVCCIYMAALQEQRAAFGTRYEVPEVSFSITEST